MRNYIRKELRRKTKSIDNGDTSGAFLITNGVKQGCTLPPILFCFMFMAMLQHAFHHYEDGIHIIYWTHGRLHNQCHVKAVMTVKQTVIRGFQFANDFALNATSKHDMQDGMDRFSTACDNSSLTISTKKTEVMFQPVPGKPYLKPHITTNHTVLNDVEKFTYLASTISRHANIDQEITCRIAKASTMFGRL